MFQIENEISLELYRELLRIRLIEEEIVHRYKEQKMRCPVHLSIGQEAIAVGVCAALEKRDYLISNHRAHAHYLAKGGDLKKMMAEIYGKETGCSGGFGGSMHLTDSEANVVATTPIVGGSIPVGVGVAFAAAKRNENAITVIFFGEGATEEGVWSESINFASLHKLPILFVCENNLYSCYSPMEVRQSPERSRLAIAEAHGIRSFHGDGNDVEQVFAIANQTVDLVRKNQGPCFLELDTYRYREHCGPYLDPEGYRPPDEVEYWNKKCPVSLHANFLLEQGMISAEYIENVKKELLEEIQEAFSFAEQSSFPRYNPNQSIYA